MDSANFIELLKRSQLIDEPKLSGALEQIRQTSGADIPELAVDLAKLLVRTKSLPGGTRIIFCKADIMVFFLVGINCFSP